ncbi:MAG: MMPL family transporter [Flavobacteriales bacterium]|nr:MMPL family transporter [Flavobacteriales bacterium]
MGKLFVGIYDLVASKRWLFLSLILACFLFAGFLASRLTLEEDIERMMPTDNKIAELNKILQSAKFMDKMVLTASLSDSTATDPDLLIEYVDAFVDSISRRYQPEYIEEITYRFDDNIIQKVYGTFYENLPLFLTENDYLALDTMTAPESLAKTIEKNYKTLVSPVSMILKKFIVKDPIGVTGLAMKKMEELRLDDNYKLRDGYVITKDDKHILFFLTSANPNNETQNNSILLEGIDKTMKETAIAFNGEVKGEYFGAMAVAVGNARRIEADIKLTVTIAMVILMLFISLFYRKPTIFVFILMPVFFGGTFGLAALYLVKSNVSTVALAVGSVLLGITIDFALHTITHFKTVRDPRKVLRDISTPIFMSCLTTASAFLCLYMVRAEALNELGLFAAVSVFAAAMFCIVVLPHLLKFKKRPAPTANGEEDTAIKLNLLERFAAKPFEKNKVLLAVVVLVTIGCFFTYSNVSFEEDMMKMNYMSDELQQAEKNLNNINSYTLKSVFVVSSAPTLNEALQKNEKSVQGIRKLQKQGLVKNYAAVSNLMLSDSLQRIKIDRWNSYWTREKKELVKSTLLTEGAKFKFKAKAFQQFYNLLDTDFQVVDLSTFDELRNNFLSEYISEDEDISTVTTQLKVERKDVQKVYTALENIGEVTVVDKQYITERFISILAEDFSKLVKVSLIIVFLILFVAYGRIELALITFIPMVISWLWTLGLMGLLGIKFNIFNIIISTFVFGLGIDYSIFITRGLLQEYKTGAKHIGSYKTSILLSAFTTIVGIGVLILAEHPALKSIATLSIIGILSVVFVSFTIQPLMFRFMISSRREKGNAPMLLPNLIGSIALFIVFILGMIIMTLTGVIFLIPPVKKNKRRKLFYHYIIMFLARLVVKIPFNVKKVIINETNEDFSKPCVIVANHQSHIDIPLILMLHPKLIILVNDWVYSNPYYGAIVRMADFYPVSGGFEEGLNSLKEKVADGYSVLVFPEGTRQKDCKIQRYHKGAFLLAQELKLDIVPVLLHGVGHVMKKGDNFIKGGKMTVKILPRIPLGDTSYGQTGRRKSKEIGQYCRDEFDKLREEIEVPAYFAREIEKNYIYKHPGWPWYVKIKLKLENNYEYFNSIIPKKGKIVDIGCGIGYFPFMLQYLSEEREILGIDYDGDKIEIAQNCAAKGSNVEFIAGDATTIDLPHADAFILLDILHYLPKQKQEIVLERIFEKVNEGGMVIVRDADASLEERTKGTKMTEIFSTRIMNFNKTEYDLEFVSRDFIIEVSKRNNMEVEIVDNTKRTSNVIYIIKRLKNVG